MGTVLKAENVSIRYITGDFKEIGLKEYTVRKLTKNYHVKEFMAVDGVSFELEDGDMLGIIGTNGAGKSTLLKAIAGIMEPTRGQITAHGEIAALLELGSGFDGDLTVKENAYLRGAMLGYTKDFMDQTYDQIIDFAELRDFENRAFKQLSSGMKSRLAFSIASLVEPDILILDEVLSVGDGAFRKKSEDKMREIIGKGATTILVSHSLDQVREMCNKVLWLDHGCQIAFGDTEQICNQYEEYLDTGVLPLPDLQETGSEKTEIMHNTKCSVQESVTREICKNVQHKIDSFDSLRMMAMLLVFTNHVWAYFPFDLPKGIGGRGAEIFTALSGFLLAKKYCGEYASISIRDCIKSMVVRMQKFYVLHIVTLVMMLRLTAYYNGFNDSVKTLLTNIFWIQSWVPSQDVYWAYNGVAWYLSSILFCYFAFPLIVRVIDRQNNLIAIGIVALCLLNIGYSIGMKHMPNAGYFLYIFPPYRLVQFTIGAIFGRYIGRRPIVLTEISRAKYVLVNVGVVILFVAMAIMLGEVFNSAMYFSVIVCIIVLLSRVPNANKPSAWRRVARFFSSISFEFYLIHHVVIRYHDYYGAFPKAINNINWVTNVLYVFVVSVLLSWLWHTCASGLKKLANK